MLNLTIKVPKTQENSRIMSINNQLKITTDIDNNKTVEYLSTKSADYKVTKTTSTSISKNDIIRYRYSSSNGWQFESIGYGPTTNISSEKIETNMSDCAYGLTSYYEHDFSGSDLNPDTPHLVFKDSKTKRENDVIVNAQQSRTTCRTVVNTKETSYGEAKVEIDYLRETGFGSIVDLENYPPTFKVVDKGDYFELSSINIIKKRYLWSEVRYGYMNFPTNATNGELYEKKAWINSLDFDYDLQSITLKFFGKNIELNITDGSFSYGGGNKPHALNGNELLQDSATVGNKLLTEHLAENVLKQYQNGKETATLLCSISDYFDKDKNIAISIKDIKATPNTNEITWDIITDSNGYDSIIFTKPDYLIPYNVKFEFEYYTTGALLQSGFMVEISRDKVTYTFIPHENHKVTLVRIVSVTAVFNKKTFAIGDEVIPMIYTVNGTDEPMSRYKDGTAKIFTVVGRDITYDGAVWQKLYLQEKSQ